MHNARIALAVVAAAFVGATALHAKEHGELEHWNVTGPDGAKELRAHGYEGGLDHTQSHSGHGSAYLRAISEHPDYKHAVIWQSISSERYRGKRVKLSAWMKTDRAQVARVGIKVSSPGDNSLAYGQQDTTGTTDWRRYEVVLDVAPRSNSITFGLLLEGSGAAWMDEVRLEVVDERTPITNLPPPSPIEPENLDFEQ